MCPQISPLPWECALQLWPALQGVILGCDLFNYNPHHCTVTWSEGCDCSYQCNQDIGTFPHGQTSSTYFIFFFFFSQAPNFPSFQSALGRLSVCYTSWGWGNSQMPAEMRTICAFKLLGAVFNGTATLPEPVSLLETGTLQIASLAASRAPAQRCVARGLCAALQVMSQVCLRPCGLHQCSSTIWHPI